MTDQDQGTAPVPISSVVSEVVRLLDSNYDGSVKSMSDMIRREIMLSRKSQYRIAQEAGVAQSQLSRFMSGEVGLTTATLDRLLPVLGLRLVQDRRRRA